MMPSTPASLSGLTTMPMHFSIGSAEQANRFREFDMDFSSTNWRELAEEMRKVAGRTRDRHAKETMLSIAHDYELLAAQSEELEKRQMRSSRSPNAAWPL